MSLKAKLEAVIYAAEEPVTLTQLAALFAPEALEWKAEQAAAAAEATAELAAEALDANRELPLQTAEIELSEPALQTEETAQDTEQQALAREAESPAAAPEDLPGAMPAVAETAAGSPETESLDDPEAESKRLARLRDREVKGVLKQLLDELIAGYASDNRGLEIREIAGGYRMATKPECHDAVRLFVKSLKPPLKLSLPALETLAVVAYKQPVTAPEVSEIRGVESGGVLGSLLSRKLVATAGRKQVIGRPILYKTTKEFLLRFGLRDLAELPSMEEFEKMAAIEIEEEMEPEEAAANAADQAADAEAQAQAQLEENSPSGEELSVEIAEATEPSEGATGAEPAPAEEESTAPAEEPTAETADSAETTSASSNEPEPAPAEPESIPQAEIETVPHAQETQEER